MKRTLERFLMMYPGEVLNTFAQLPGAIVNKDYIYVPGTLEKRILLVGHADTVSNKPPDYLNWQGHLLSGGWKYTAAPKTEVKALPATVAPVLAPPAHTPLSEAIREVALAQLEAKHRAAGTSRAPSAASKVQAAYEVSKGKASHILAAEAAERMAERMDITGEHSLTELNSDAPPASVVKEYQFPRPSTNDGVTPIVSGTRSKIVDPDFDEEIYEDWGHGGYGGRWAGSGYSGYYDKCLGADDRAGIAILWLMRRSGHSLLITDHEETGGQGATRAAHDLEFELSEHQFAMQIDRRYDQEMVFYDVSTLDFENYMQKQTNYRVGNGSFTDISIICPSIGICGVNLSAGYWNEHSSDEMLSYDAWLRTYNVVHRMLWRQTHPRFILPPPPPVVKKAKYGGFSQADAEWWSQQTGRLLQGDTPLTVSVRDEEVIAYQVGQMVFCRAKCEDYYPIAQYDSPQAPFIKLRQQDISEWDTCETCGAKLWEQPDRALEGSPQDDDEVEVELEGEATAMVHLTGPHSQFEREMVGA